jgi:hypothetical protein
MTFKTTWSSHGFLLWFIVFMGGSLLPNSVIRLNRVLCTTHPNLGGLGACDYRGANFLFGP